MLFVINTQCNRDCSYCFEGELRRQQPPRMMTVEDIHRIARWAGPSYMFENNVLGGEPTLHPQLIPIMDAIGKYGNRSPVLLTNGVGEPEVMRELAKRPIRFLVNLNHLDAYSDAEKDRLMTNLDILRGSFVKSILLSVTMVDPEDDFSILFDILRSPLGENVASVRLGVCSPGNEFANPFPREFSHEIGKAYTRFVTTVHRIQPNILVSNECALNGCMVDEPTALRLKGLVNKFEINCKGGNFDILPDFSTHWCYGAQSIPELRVDNIFDFQNMDHLYWHMFHAKERLQWSLGSQCDHAKCDFLGCHGPCVVQNYYRKHREQIDSSLLSKEPSLTQ